MIKHWIIWKRIEYWGKFQVNMPLIYFVCDWPCETRHWEPSHSMKCLITWWIALIALLPDYCFQTVFVVEEVSTIVKEVKLETEIRLLTSFTFVLTQSLYFYRVYGYLYGTADDHLHVKTQLYYRILFIFSTLLLMQHLQNVEIPFAENCTFLLLV